MLLIEPLLDFGDAAGQFVDGALLGNLGTGQFPVELLAGGAPSRIFLLGAAGEQEENGLGASASGPADLTQKMSPSAVESCPRR